MKRLLWAAEGAHIMRGPVFGIDLRNFAGNKGSRRGDVALVALRFCRTRQKRFL
jgi:hypothetical protein